MLSVRAFFMQGVLSDKQSRYVTGDIRIKMDANRSKTIKRRVRSATVGSKRKMARVKWLILPQLTKNEKAWVKSPSLTWPPKMKDKRVRLCVS